MKIYQFKISGVKDHVDIRATTLHTAFYKLGRTLEALDKLHGVSISRGTIQLLGVFLEAPYICPTCGAKVTQNCKEWHMRQHEKTSTEVIA
jgi:N-acetylglucosamine-6-phosphate deacetylase